MKINRKIYLLAFLTIGIIALFFNSYINDQPIREIAWEYVEKHDWNQDGTGKWSSAVSTTIAGDHYSHSLLDPSYNGKKVFKVEFFGGDGPNGVPGILVSKDTMDVVGVIPTE